MQYDPHALKVLTDGSCYKNPGLWIQRREGRESEGFHQRQRDPVSRSWAVSGHLPVSNCCGWKEREQGSVRRVLGRQAAVHGEILCTCPACDWRRTASRPRLPCKIRRKSQIPSH